MRRRTFLASLPIGATILSCATSSKRSGEFEADLCIVGGGFGGCAAALAACDAGLKVVMTEATDWVGGQVTSQMVPPDENPWIDKSDEASSESYRRFRQLSRQAANKKIIHNPGEGLVTNPGSCGVSYMCLPPQDALVAISQILEAHLESGRLTILYQSFLETSEVENDHIRTIKLRNIQGETIYVKSRYFIDATETGELIEKSDCEFVLGSESREMTGERHASSLHDPGNLQAPTWCMALGYDESRSFDFEKPQDYDYWKEYTPNLEPDWSGKLLSLSYTQPITLDKTTAAFDPRPGAVTGGFNLWTYRRLQDPQYYGKGGGISLINWPQNDYMDGNLFGGSLEENKRHNLAAKNLSHCLFYWLKTEVPREDGGRGWPGLFLANGASQTEDGLAKAVYHRESRRIKAEFTVLEQHLSLESRMNETGLSLGSVTATQFHDSVGIGSYRIDLHPSTRGDNYIDISSLPFQIPLGSMIPVRMENLIPACKNIGTTHITNGCYRLHPVEWAIGEAAGSLAAYCIRKGQQPRSLRNVESHLKAFQSMLERRGVPLSWSDDIKTQAR